MSCKTDRSLGSALAWLLVAIGSPPLLADDPSTSAPRPMLYVTLKSGEVLEGQLHRFDKGTYTIVASGRTFHFEEADAKSIAFYKSIAVKDAKDEYAAWSTPKLLEAFINPGPDVKNRSYGDERLIGPLAHRGPEVILPLMAATAKNSSIYQNVGRVFAELGPEHYPLILDQLRRGNPGASYPFFWALRESGVKSASLLRELLTDDDKKVREFAIGSLYDIGIQAGTVLPLSLTPVLLKALDDPHASVRTKVPSVLAMVGRPVDDIMPPLLDALKVDSSRSDLASHAALALTSMCRKLRAEDPWQEKVTAAMVAAMRHPSSTVRSYGAMHFGQFKQRPSPLVISALKRAADDPEEYVRGRARASLYKFKIAPSRSTDIANLRDRKNSELVELLAGEDRTAANNAWTVLSTREPSEELLGQLMAGVVRDTNYSYWNQIAGILAKWDAATAAQWLEEYASHDNALVRRTVALAYASMNLKSFPQSLKRLAKDPDKLTRSEAIRTIGRIAENATGEMFEASVPLLLEFVQDQSIHSDYHYGAIDSLTEVGASHPDVVPAMIGWARSALNADFREAMIDHLGELGADLRPGSKPRRQITEILVGLLASERNAEVKTEVIYALQYMRASTMAVKKALELAQDDSSAQVSKAASDALQKIGNP